MKDQKDAAIGWLYFVQPSSFPELVKIGITERANPKLRNDELDNPTVLARVLVSGPRQHELELHKTYKAKRLPQSEYFRLDEDEIKQVIDYMERAAHALQKHVVKPVAPAKPAPASKHIPTEEELKRAEEEELRRQRHVIRERGEREYQQMATATKNREQREKERARKIAAAKEAEAIAEAKKGREAKRQADQRRMYEELYAPAPTAAIPYEGPGFEFDEEKGCFIEKSLPKRPFWRTW